MSWTREIYGIGPEEVCAGCSKNFMGHYGMDCYHDTGKEKFRRKAEPSKVELRVGQRWRRELGSPDGSFVVQLLEQQGGLSWRARVVDSENVRWPVGHESGGWGGFANPGKHWTLLSDPSSPTKEAEVVIDVKTDGSFGGGTVTFKPVCDDKTTSTWAPPPMSEAEICAATEKRNAEYQLEQAAAIKKRWLEQQANPRQYLAYGVVTAGGWMQRGHGRK